MSSRSPRASFVTVYGRIPVLEALRHPSVEVDKVLLARTARGESVDEIVAAARERNVPLQRVAPERVTRISRNGRHDQGVVADVVAPRLAELDEWLTAGDGPLVVLDGVTNPSNVGMIIRTAVAAGMAGVVLPRAGVPDVGPLVVKASAGVAFEAPLLRCGTAAEGVRSLRRAGFSVVGLAGGAGVSLYELPIPQRAALVLGNETEGISEAVGALVDEWAAIPLAGGVESLNVATAAAVACFELSRRRLG